MQDSPVVHSGSQHHHDKRGDHSGDLAGLILRFCTPDGKDADDIQCHDQEDEEKVKIPQRKRAEKSGSPSPDAPDSGIGMVNMKLKTACILVFITFFGFFRIEYTEIAQIILLQLKVSRRR